MIQYTTVDYNGITMRNCLTRQFIQESVYDDSSTDLLYHRFRIRVVGYISAKNPPNPDGPDTFIDGGFRDTSAASNHYIIRHSLMEPRKEFVMRLGDTEDGAGGVELLKAVPAKKELKISDHIDLNNGPKTNILSITNVSADNVLRIEFEIEICKLECESASREAKVLSNRWSWNDEIDENFMTTRTYTGRLRVADSTVSPHDFRGYVVPPLQPGMRRQRMGFTSSTDGLTLDYTIIDREIVFSAPAPATKWSYSHKESLLNGTMTFGEMSVSLRGDRNVNRGILIQMIAAIMDAKLLSAPDAAEQQQIVTDFSITDEVNDTEAWVHGSARVQRSVTVDVWLGVQGRRLGQPLDIQGGRFKQKYPDYDANISRGSRVGEVLETSGPLSPAGAFAVYLQSPCDENHQIIAGTIGKKSSGDTGSQNPPIEYRESEDLPADNNTIDVSAEHISAIYTYFRQDSHIIQKGGYVHLPRAADMSQAPPGTQDAVALGILTLPTFRRIVRVEAERVGAEPKLPTPENIPSNPPQVLLDLRIVPQTHTTTPDGKLVYRTSAEYVFAIMGIPDLVSGTLPVGSSPWSNLVYQESAGALTGGKA